MVNFKDKRGKDPELKSHSLIFGVICISRGYLLKQGKNIGRGRKEHLSKVANAEEGRLRTP